MKKSMFYDKDFRQKVRQLDEESLAKTMASRLGDTQVKVLVNTKDTSYFVIPAEANNADIKLQSIQAAGGFSSIGSVGSLGCASSTISTSGTASSASTELITDLFPGLKPS